MKITKFGHCCLLIEEQGVRILADPGIFTTTQNDIKNIDLLLITHEHPDHYHVDSVKAILKNNPTIKVITNTTVGKLLEKENIAYEVVEHGSMTTFKDLLIEGFGKDHAEIYNPIVPVVQNTGYFIANKLFYPGDAFYNPGKPVDILALPIAGPWCKVKEVVEYALAIKPRIIFPVHDAILKQPGMNQQIPEKAVTQQGIQFIALEIGKETTF